MAIDQPVHKGNLTGHWWPYVFSARSAAVLGSSNVSTPNTPERYQVSPAPNPAAPEDGRTPLNTDWWPDDAPGCNFILAAFRRTCSDLIMPTSMPLVQLALDFPTIDEALRLAEIGVRAGVDILEAGTPLIVAQGAECIGSLARAFPDYPILADYKTMDSGGKNVLLTQKQGGHYMTVCANAADETVKAAVAAGKQTGIKVVTDMIGVKDIAARGCVVAHWGVDMIYLHYAADQRRADGTRDSTQWLEAVLAVTDAPVGVGTFGVEDAVRAVRGGAQLVAIGHPLFDSADVLGALKHYVEHVKANYQPRK